MTLAQMESRFFELKGKLAVKLIADDEFQREMEELRFQDQQGRWWMIGAQSGRWYYFDGSRWLLGQPPEPPAQPAPPLRQEPTQPGPSPSPPPAPRASPSTTAPNLTPPARPTSPPPYVPPPQSFTPSQYTPPPQPAHTDKLAGGAPPRAQLAAAPTGRTPTLAERVRGEMSQVHVPPVHVPPVHMEVHAPAPIRRYPPNIILIGAVVLGLVFVALMWLAVDNFVPGKPISSFFGKSLGLSAATRTPPARLTPLAGGANNVDNLLRVGDDLVAQSQFAPALTQYQAASKIAPNDAEIYEHWARALALTGRIQEAIDNAQRATRLDDKSAAAFAELCRALAWSGQTDAAISAGQQATTLDPKSAAAHAFLAEAYLRAGRQGDAQNESAAAMQLDDANADAHRAAGWVAALAGRKEEAVSEWQRVTQIAPDIYFYHFEFGQAYSAYLQDPVAAITEFQKAIELYPPYVPSYIALGRVYLAQNQPGPGILQFQKALTFDPASSEAYTGLGQAFQMQNRCSQAIPYFQKSLQLDGGAGEAQRGLASCGALAQNLVTPEAPPDATPGLVAVPTAIAEATIVPVAATLPTPNGPAPTSAAAPSTGSNRGGRIAFAMYDGQYHLYIANADGSNRTLLVELASDPEFSPDGSQLLYTSWQSDQRGIHRIEANGTSDQQISLRIEDLLPSWSPDGTRYIYSTRSGAGSDINKRSYMLRIDDPTTKATQDPLDFVVGAQYPDWGSNNRIVFRDCGFPTQTCGLAVVNADGSHKTTLVDNMNATAPAWSPDGTLVAFTSNYGGNWDVYIVSANGGSPSRLTTDPAEDGLPTFSPDGKQIAYLSHSGGTWAIWAMGIDGSNQHKLFDLGGDPAGPVPGNPPGQPGQVWWEQKISWH